MQHGVSGRRSRGLRFGVDVRDLAGGFVGRTVGVSGVLAGSRSLSLAWGTSPWSSRGESSGHGSYVFGPYSNATDALGVVVLILIDVLAGRPRRIPMRRGLDTNPSIGLCKMVAKKNA